jgi:hypothetical protein
VLALVRHPHAGLGGDLGLGAAGRLGLDAEGAVELRLDDLADLVGGEGFGCSASAWPTMSKISARIGGAVGSLGMGFISWAWRVSRAARSLSASAARFGELASLPFMAFAIIASATPFIGSRSFSRSSVIGMIGTSLETSGPPSSWISRVAPQPPQL